MTTPDALTVLRELREETDKLVLDIGTVFGREAKNGAASVRALIREYIARLEREQAEAIRVVSDPDMPKDEIMLISGKHAVRAKVRP